MKTLTIETPGGLTTIDESHERWDYYSKAYSDKIKQHIWIITLKCNGMVDENKTIIFDNEERAKEYFIDMLESDKKAILSKDQSITEIEDLPEECIKEQYDKAIETWYNNALDYNSYWVSEGNEVGDYKVSLNKVEIKKDMEAYL